jgi:hypothetical protein
MKKMYKSFTIKCLFVFVLLIGLAFAQEPKTYVLTFPEYPMQDIKPLVSLTRQVFEVPIEIKNDDYKVFYYTTEKIVKEEDVVAALNGSKYSLISFEVKK